MSEAADATTSEGQLPLGTDSGTQPPDWKTDIETDLKANPSFEKFSDSGSLPDYANKVTRSYYELQKALGGDRIALPKADAPQEEWDAFRAKTGRPETPDGYGLQEWAPPDGIPWDEKTTRTMIERFHAHGLDTKQAQGILNDYAKTLEDSWNEHLEGIERLNTQTTEALQSEWGSAYEPKMEAAKRAAVHFAGPSGEEGNLFDQLTLADGRALGDHEAIIRIFAAMGEKMAEDGEFGVPVKRTTRTPDEAKREYDQMLGDPTRLAILKDMTHPEHKALQERKTELEKQIYNV